MRASQSLRDCAHVMALTAAPADLKRNENHFSFSISECIKPVKIISATRCPVLFRSFSAALNAVVNPIHMQF